MDGKDWLAFAAAVLVSAAFFLVSIFVPYDTLGGFGYIGAFLMALVSSATILIPGTILPVIAAMGVYYSPALLGIACGLGSAIGELTGYYAGLYGRYTLNLKSLPEFMNQQKWLESSETFALFVLAAIPNPFFDIAGLAAGALKVPFFRFFVPVMLGKMLKYGVTAWLGVTAWGWLISLG
jgi:membrane protein YqaA with SNARE-associated domain